ncbi:MAG: hypothetical protein IKU83_07040 [Lachnospiraceae bacterium]|nr:hypothetical protein [Lachnospiraceae bacterium]
MTDLLEVLMMICFGLSWPISIHKSWTSRTAKGKSLFFECFIWVGYWFGIVRKFLLYQEAVLGGATLGWLFYLGWLMYVVNVSAVTVDMCLYFRNRRLDQLASNV